VTEACQLEKTGCAEEMPETKNEMTREQQACMKTETSGLDD
jgi:hypothetical protein